MSFLLTLLGLGGAGLALLHLTRLATGRLAVDLPLGWLVGQGWFALGALSLRFLAGVPFGPAAVLILALLPPAALGLLRWRRPALAPRPTPAFTGPPRWRPRPGWLFLPMATAVVLVALAIAGHSLATPTMTDDGVRVRAFVPMVAFWDDWNAAARNLLLLAGPVPTFVPAFAWALGAPLDHFHVNLTVLADLAAVLWLAVALAAANGRPERGWAQGFALLSVPLAVFHLTATYSDVVLALHLAAGLLFALEYGRDGRAEDAGRAMLLLVVAALVKREGEVVAGAAGAVLLAHAAWRGRTGGRRALRLAGLALAPALLVLAAKVAAVGWREAIPVVNLLAARAATAAAAAPAGPAEAHAPALFARSLFLSSNFGLVFWLWPAATLARLPTVLRRGYAWPLMALLLVLLESAVSAIWLLPAYTLDGTTVHRALLSVAVPVAVWLGALLTEPDEPSPAAVAAAAPPAPRRARKPKA